MAARYAGAVKRYAYVYVLGDGSVYGRSQHGYQRRYESVAEAKAGLQ